MSKNIAHEGVIIGIRSNIIYVRIIQQTACSDCHARKACHASDNQEKIIEITHFSGNYKEGDKVLITGKTSMGLQAVGFAFVFPLAIMTILLIFAVRSGLSEGFSALISIASLVIYYFIIYFFRNKFKQKFTFSIQ